GTGTSTTLTLLFTICPLLSPPVWYRYLHHTHPSLFTICPLLSPPVWYRYLHHTHPSLPGLSPPVWYRYPHHTPLSLASSTHTLLRRVTLNLQWLAPSCYFFYLVLYTICLRAPECFVDYEHSCLPNHGTDCLFPHCSHRLFGLPSYSNHLSYSCYLMKLLYNMILLPSHAHSDIINQHCRALPVLCRALIVLLLMVSGNLYVHPGPSVASPNYDLCFTDFCSRKSLGFLHVNTGSLLPKMDQLKVWVHSSNRGVLVITETLLRKHVLNTDVNLSGYNLFRQDGSSKGGGVAIFTKDHLQCTVVSTKSVPKQLDFLVLSIKLSNSYLLTVAGCYCPPSAPACTLPALSSHPEKATLHDVILTNIPDSYQCGGFLVVHILLAIVFISSTSLISVHSSLSQFSHYFDSTYSSSFNREEKRPIYSLRKESKSFPGQQLELDLPQEGLHQHQSHTHHTPPRLGL
ncbi:unnamed protein product, partial [Oncorhynchus mykiss]